MPDRYLVDPDDKSQRSRITNRKLLVQSSSAAPDAGSYPFMRYLDTNGDGSGTKNAVGNYAAGVTEFYISPQDATEFPMILHRMVATVRDVGNFGSGIYGAGAALTNGFEIQVRDSDENVLLDLTDELEIKTNGDWGRTCYDVQQLNLGGGDSYLSVRWTFAKSGKPVRLDKGHRLAVRLNDSFAFLTGHFFNVQGYVA